MKSKTVFWGMLFISIGILWILKSLGIISFSWFVFIKLWPLILIWIGIKMLPIQDKWKTIFNVTVLTIGIVFLLILSNTNCCNHKWKKSICVSKEWSYTCNEDNTDTVLCTNDNFIKYENSFENAHLQLTATAGKFVFAPGKELFAIKEAEKSQSNITVRSIIEDGNTINIKAEVNPSKKIRQHYSNKYNILLNSNPVWSMNLDLNATSGKIDLSEFKIKELEIESNASSLDLKLGSLYDNVSVKVESNASSVKVYLPHSMKCFLKKDENTLSSLNVKGLNKQSNNQYASDGIGENAGVIKINIGSSVSSVDVRRY